MKKRTAFLATAVITAGLAAGVGTTTTYAEELPDSDVKGTVETPEKDPNASMTDAEDFSEAITDRSAADQKAIDAQAEYDSAKRTYEDAIQSEKNIQQDIDNAKADIAANEKSVTDTIDQLKSEATEGRAEAENIVAEQEGYIKYAETDLKAAYVDQKKAHDRLKDIQATIPDETAARADFAQAEKDLTAAQKVYDGKHAAVEAEVAKNPNLAKAKQDFEDATEAENNMVETYNQRYEAEEMKYSEARGALLEVHREVGLYELSSSEKDADQEYRNVRWNMEYTKHWYTETVDANYDESKQVALQQLADETADCNQKLAEKQRLEQKLIAAEATLSSEEKKRVDDARALFSTVAAAYEREYSTITTEYAQKARAAAKVRNDAADVYYPMRGQLEDQSATFAQLVQDEQNAEIDLNQARDTYDILRGQLNELEWAREETKDLDSIIDEAEQDLAAQKAELKKAQERLSESQKWESEIRTWNVADVLANGYDTDKYELPNIDNALQNIADLKKWIADRGSDLAKVQATIPALKVDYDSKATQLTEARATQAIAVANFEKYKPSYVFIQGNDVTVDADKVDEFVIATNGEFDWFDALYVDGKLVDKKNYTVVKGSTYVTLKKEFLDTLEAGVHTIAFAYDYEISTVGKFTIKRDKVANAENAASGTVTTTGKSATTVAAPTTLVAATTVVAPVTQATVTSVGSAETSDTTNMAGILAALLTSGAGLYLMSDQKKKLARNMSK